VREQSNESEVGKYSGYRTQTAINSSALSCVIVGCQITYRVWGTSASESGVSCAPSSGSDTTLSAPVSVHAQQKCVDVPIKYRVSRSGCGGCGGQREEAW
jgi:hypothetical protein